MEVPFPDEFDCFGTTSSAKDEIADIFGKREYFSTPKPVKLIKELIRVTTNESSIVMDFLLAAVHLDRQSNRSMMKMAELAALFSSTTVKATFAEP